MISLIFVWSMLTAPADRLVCSMWINTPPTNALMAQAGCTWSQEQASGYILRAVDAWTGQVACERPASELPTLTCDLYPLDHYVLRVFEPDYQAQVCTILVTHTGPPSAEEIHSACDAVPAHYKLKLVSSGPADPPPIVEQPFCEIPPLTVDTLPPDPSGLATRETYNLLDDHLRWYYGIPGMASDWQNTYDVQIYSAALKTRVPPRVIKFMFAKESQFWPLWTGDEVGLGQLTDDGADLALRMSHDLYAEFCPLATRSCGVGYDIQPKSVKQLMRDVLRRSLRVYGTPRQAAEAAGSQVLTWARILAAYYCVAGEMASDAGAAPSWSLALAAYHAGPSCVVGGTICQAGLEYLNK